MTIFIGADHRGFELKNKLVEYLQNKDIRVEDLGNYELDPEDDYPDFAQKVAQAVLADKMIISMYFQLHLTISPRSKHKPW
ncbi:MAG: Ribose-5-phosphate isomerase B [Candidatus Roizmanbacteria bacterium GW2011_GWA2_37_7]|uniref:Ribose-5-phosphate isomerase B n=1 Tax=Candidatus Roizmanbacteria bacterium GW2011_GWA2_37_7 TaxID=1618481 RepID=A0A0G0GZ75_9BACT|nr:MAG: Ribose-5-phosphate isomerase B [Candidatus Roizmanbacteria bacterium GW2011_GWA2_37_7]